MTTDPILKIAVCDRRNNYRYKNQEHNWSWIKEHNRRPVRTTETVAEYPKLPKEQRDELKDHGGFVGGWLKSGVRKKGHVISRCVGCLDADNIPADVNFPVLCREKLIDNLEKKMTELKEMIQYAKDMRDSHSLTLKISDIITDEDPQVVLAVKRIVTHIIAKLFSYLDSPNELMKKSYDLSDDISDFTSHCAGFLQMMQTAKENMKSHDSDEVQNYICRFLEKLSNFYGVAVYLLYESVREIEPESLGLSEEDTEDYAEFLSAMNICAKWFKKAKTMKQIQNYDLFRAECKEDILLLDEQEGESTEELLIDIIQTIVNIPSEIKEDDLDRLVIGYNIGVDEGAKEVDDVSEEEIEKVKAFGQFMLDALKYYVSNLTIVE